MWLFVKCQEADEMCLYKANKAVYTFYPVWFLFDWYFLITLLKGSFVNIIDTAKSSCKLCE